MTYQKLFTAFCFPTLHVCCSVRAETHTNCLLITGSKVRQDDTFQDRRVETHTNCLLITGSKVRQDDTFQDR